MIQLFLWGALFVLFVIIEATTPQLVSIWFAAGALVSFIVALFTDSWLLQIALFAVVAIALLFCTRPLLKKFVVPRYVKTNAAESLIGKSCVVTTTIDNMKNTGRVLEHGFSWNARSAQDGITFKEGETVVVVRLEGVTAYVVAA